MLRQICLKAAKQAARPQLLQPTQQLVRHFGGPVVPKSQGKTFRPASPSEPDMEYVETPSMLYLTGVVTVSGH
eukprot:g19467.t1